jgi:hypothetical protein
MSGTRADCLPVATEAAYTVLGLPEMVFVSSMADFATVEKL